METEGDEINASGRRLSPAFPCTLAPKHRIRRRARGPFGQCLWATAALLLYSGLGAEGDVGEVCHASGCQSNTGDVPNILKRRPGLGLLFIAGASSLRGPQNAPHEHARWASCAMSQSAMCYFCTSAL